MAAITASMVKELREMSGAGMMDCKKALTETDGDFDKAVEFLREKGLATAVKKAGRIAAEGIVMTTVVDGGKKAAMVEVNAETDFVAKNEVFQTYVKEVVDQIVSTDVQDVEALKNEKWALDPSMTVAEKHAAMVAKIGENMNIRRFAKISTDGHIVSYIHAGGKIGVLVEADTDASGEAIDECMCKIETEICLFLCQSHYIRQICQHISLSDWLRLQLQATGFHCFQQLIKICRKQQDHRIRRWLLNRLQHGILCLYIQKLRIRDNVNLILSFIRFDVNCIYELVTNLIH